MYVAKVHPFTKVKTDEGKEYDDLLNQTQFDYRAPKEKNSCSTSLCFPSQARNQGGAPGAFAPPSQAPKVRILILNIQVEECSRLN